MAPADGEVDLTDVENRMRQALNSSPDQTSWEQLSLDEAARFINNEARARQEAAWAHTNIDSRQIWSVREAQSIYSRQLRRSIDELLRVRALAAGLRQVQSVWSRLLPPIASKILDFEGLRGDAMDFALCWENAGPRRDNLLVCVRKRPLLAFETASGEWDAVEVMPTEAAVLCHDGRLSRSGRQLLMSHRRFAVDRVWGASATTKVVYHDVVLSMLQSAMKGHGSTLLCMGQTGTGKTHTISGISECLCRDLKAFQIDIEVEFFEIYGKKCLDLLADRREVHLRSDENGQVHVRGQRRVKLAEGFGLHDLLEKALKLRASEETERNASSSRSHAICTLHLQRQTSGSGGILRMVDLAGSERNYETTKMTAAQHRESAEINSSLMVLKECFRAHVANQRGESVLMPFRNSRLTRVLRECFTDASHKTAVIATISPAASDVIHTVNTLLHATMLVQQLFDLTAEVTLDIPLHLEGSGRPKDTPVLEWTPEDVLAWLQEAESGRFAHVVVPPGLDGRRLLTTSAQGLSELFEGALRTARAEPEGEAWTVQVDNVGTDLGRQLFAAARRVALAQGHVGEVHRLG